MDPIWIATAFIFGAAASRIGLPPMVGYLVAGFALNSFGVEGGEPLSAIADLGVTLLLFTVGLKLKLKTLAQPEVWAGATLHMLITVVVLEIGIVLLAVTGISMFRLLGWKLSLFIAFALSFSSTVFAVKVFEEKREMSSRYAGTAIGILIMQDIIAVVFLAVSAGKTPSPWAVLLIAGLFLIRPLLFKFIARCSHGELLMLFGFFMTAAGYYGFEWVGLKGDLGALIIGMLIAAHPSASELADKLLGFKDLFLVGFFLSIGISGSPTITSLGIAFLLTLAMPLKAILFFVLLTRFKLRARTAMLASLSLANYSEFGLIVGAICVANGWIGSEWLVILAIALSMTFIIAAPANSFAHAIYARWSPQLKRLETAERLPDESPIGVGDARIAVIGMGEIGTAAYDEMRRRSGEVIIGLDFCADTVRNHCQQGRHVVHGDAADCDFWERVEPSSSRLEIIMMTLPDPRASVFAIRQLKENGYPGQIAACVHYEEDISTLEQAGINAAYVVCKEAGVGFANHVSEHMDHCHV